MICELTQEFYFEAAHTLQRDIQALPSQRFHGHTYHAEITLRGELAADSAMLLDLGLFREQLELVRVQLDHHLLDDVTGVGEATLENLCRFIWRALSPNLPGLSRVTVARRASGDRCSVFADA
jgi:6-pyruvoyltetrahydropterin/6-carboxytetrahydropterin synthase